ncbi:MAG: ribosome silencing factor [Acidobacteria bacterium]|nr:ribosome silencing factor [Acidobacteriota bacterium]
MKENPTVKEKSLHPEPAAKAARGKKSDETEAIEQEPLDERIIAALHAASDKKAHDLVVLDLRAIASFTDYFVITSGANPRQVQAIADEIVERLKKQQGTRALRVEGYRSAEWVLVDYGDFIVHVFDNKARQFYDLERLWRDAARVSLPEEIADSSLRTEEES